MIRINPFNFINQNLSVDRKKEVPCQNVGHEETVNIIDELEKWEKNQKNSAKNQPKWDFKRIPLRYSIYEDLFAEEIIKDFNKAVDSSFKTWSTASDDLMKFEKTDSTNEADITISWTNIKQTDRDYEAGRNDLKVVNNRIEKAMITIITFPLIDVNLTKEKRVERVRRTALHEIGHALGLNHSNNPKDVMFHRGINNSKLSTVDINRLAEHYKTKSLDIRT